MNNCCCEFFCGPCKRCCCNMNYRVQDISIPENVAEMMAYKVVKMKERAVSKKKLPISPDFDTKSTTSKKGDAVDEKKVRRRKVKKYSIYRAEFDAEGNPIKIRESRRKTRSVSGDGAADETHAEFDETPDEDKTNKTREKIENRRTTKVADSETTKNNDDSDAPDEDKTNKTREKIEIKRTTNVAYSETTKNNDDSDADDNAKHSIVATMVLKTDYDRLAKMCCIERSSKSCCVERTSRSCCIERPSFCICMCTPCICPDKKSPINGGASSNKRLQPNGNYGNGMQSIIEENTKTATAAEKKDSELIGEIWESVAAVVKDNLDKNFDNYFSCCIAKIEALAFRTKRNEYLLKKMHKDLKLRISILDRFMTQSNENNDGCECECTCEDNKGQNISAAK